MDKMIENIVQWCYREDILNQEDEAWFRYALERRISTTLIAIPFLLIALFFSSSATAISYISSFYYLRKYINGYHSKSVLGCFIHSLVIELAMLIVLYRVLNPYLSCLLLIVSTVVIGCFAPYCHPNMHLSETEITACRIISRKRIFYICIVSAVSVILMKHQVLYGITLGVTMATMLLVFALLSEERRSNNVESQCHYKECS